MRLFISGNVVKLTVGEFEQVFPVESIPELVSLWVGLWGSVCAKGETTINLSPAVPGLRIGVDDLVLLVHELIHLYAGKHVVQRTPTQQVYMQ